jgi:hypothetical protein
LSRDGWLKDISGANAELLRGEPALAAFFAASRPMPELANKARPPWMDRVDRQRIELSSQMPALEGMGFLDFRAVEALWELSQEAPAVFARSAAQLPSLLSEWREQPLFVGRYSSALSFLMERVAGLPPRLARGTPIGADLDSLGDVGPLAVRLPTEVRDLWSGLEKWATQQLRQSIGQDILREMNDRTVYPGGWTAPARLDALLEQYELFRPHVRRIADSQRAVVAADA